MFLHIRSQNLLKMPKDSAGGLLVLAVKRGNEIDIEYSKKKIIDKINSYFGYKLINGIKLQTDNSEIKNKKQKNPLINFTKNFEDNINQIKNEKIRNSLSQLLKTIKNV